MVLGEADEEDIPMKNNEFIFLAGLHRSGTSLLHKIIREHPEVSGFAKKGYRKMKGNICNPYMGQLSLLAARGSLLLITDHI
jgi:hypothetical protein